MQPSDDIRMLQLVLARLERVSVDSYWAHRASGVRGSLLRAMERLEAGEALSELQLEAALQQGFWILERAAQERTS